MTVVSSKEFKTHPDKYLELALNEHVYIKQGNNMFIITTINENEDDFIDDDYVDYLEAKSREKDEKTSVDDLIQHIYSKIK
jgi:hypothetical protein